MLKRTIQEKQTELRQADAEIEQARSQGKITGEQNTTALMKARYDIERAKLDLNKGDTVSRIDNEKAKLTLADAGQRLLELEEKVKSDRTTVEADVAARQRKREKAIADLQRAERGLQNLELRAPAAGLVNILPNFRAASSGQRAGIPGGGPRGRAPRSWNCRTSRRYTSSAARRVRSRAAPDGPGRDRPIEAIPGREFKARINNISVLAKVDFTSGWPPPKNFDLNLVLLDVDPKIRPGMTAVARIATERIPDVVLVPAEAIFQQDGAPNVYRLAGSEFVATRARSRPAVSRSSSPRASNRVTALRHGGRRRR